MPTTCPNCSRPVRTGATYCGFCGTNLVTYTQGGPEVQTAVRENTGSEQESMPEERTNAKRKDPGRVVSIIAIILLILIIIIAVSIQYWAYILPWVGQFLSTLFAR